MAFVGPAGLRRSRQDNKASNCGQHVCDTPCGPQDWRLGTNGLKSV